MVQGRGSASCKFTRQAGRIGSVVSPTPEATQPMTNTVYAIDFETYYTSTYSLKKLSTQRYVTDKRFDPYLVAIVGSDGYSYVGSPKEAPWEELAAGTWISHNTSFDMAVFLEYANRGKIKLFLPDEWHCTADMCAYLQAPRALAGAVKALLGREVDKSIRDEDMKGRDYHTCTPEQKQAWHDYAVGDSRDCLELWQNYSEYWPRHERRLSAETRESAWAGVGVNSKMLLEGVDSIQRTLWEAEAEIPWVKDGHKPTSTKQVKEQCAKQGIPPPRSMAQSTEVFETWLDEYGAACPWALAIGKHRQANKLHVSLNEVKARLTPEEDMSFSLKYFGAAVTGRWSGDQSLNMQNLTKQDRFGVNIRHIFKARPGKKLLIVDLSQIEPRCLAWLAGDQRFLEFVAGGADCYEAAARATGRYTDPRPLKEVDSHLRQFYKARVLGAGYGAGGAKYKLIAKLMAGLDLTSQQAAKEIREFRKENPRIVNLWNTLDSKLKQSAMLKNNDYTYTLPSGREMNYFDVQPDGRGVTASPCVDGTRRQKFWGSKLVENVTQAMARDVFGHGILKVVDAGIQFLWHVHDEIICEVDEADVNEAYQTIVGCLSETPDWAPGLPLAAEGVVADCYGNH